MSVNDTAKRAPAALLALCLLASAAPSRASTDDASRSAARALATAGVEAFQEASYQTASEKLDKAYRVLKAPSIGLWSARALVKVGKLVQASERYREVVRLDATQGDEAVQREAQADAAKELDALMPSIPAIVLQLQDASADTVSLEIDGVAVASALIGEKRPVDPGARRVVATRGSERKVVEVTLKAGETKQVTLTFDGSSGALSTPSPAPAIDSGAPPPAAGPGSGLGSQRVLALVSAGLGVAAVGVGAGFGLHAKGQRDEANQLGCTASSCPTANAFEANEAAVSAGNVSTVAFAVGAALVLGGGVLWLTAPSRKGTQVGLGPSGLRVRGAF